VKVVLAIPAYEAARVVAGVVARIPPATRAGIAEILALDDGSRDGTFAVLAALPGVTALRHPENRGYGAAQMTLHAAALERGADAVVVMHADGGHFPEELERLLAPLRSGHADVVLGSRTTGILAQGPRLLGSRTLGALVRGPMPAARLLGHLGLTALQNAAFGTRFHAWHSGFRAVTRAALRRVPFRDFGPGYLFDTEFLLAAHRARLRITEVPVSSHYDPRAGSTAEPVAYGLRVLRFVIAQRRRVARTVAAAARP
jgi:glycosyltransferase involved in cell wall biosynthesis